jgi:hypothetical protein
MISKLTDLPDGVIGFEVDGKLEGSDYTGLLVPAIEEAAGKGPVRAVVVIPSFDGMSGGAMKEDFKLGVHHLKALERMAVVTDLDWMRHFMSLFGWMVHGEMRVFPLSERADAITWAAGTD